MQDSTVFVIWFILLSLLFSCSCLGMVDDEDASESTELRNPTKDGEFVDKQGTTSSKSSKNSQKKRNRTISTGEKDATSNSSKKEVLVTPAKEEDSLEEKSLPLSGELVIRIPTTLHGPILHFIKKKEKNLNEYIETHLTDKFMSFNETEFSKKFPVNYLEQRSPNGNDFFVGQIIMDPAYFDTLKNEINHTGHKKYLPVKGAEGETSGTIIKIEKKEDVMRATGITTLHSFVQASRNGGLSIKYFRRFLQGGRVSADNPKGIAHYSNVVIDKVMVQKKITKDICFFEGTLYPNPEVFDSAQDFWEDIRNKELFPLAIHQSDTEILTIKTGKEEVVNEGKGYLLHYPDGLQEQRISSGNFQAKGTHMKRIHSMPTRGGSSGAPIFSENTDELIGIHIGIETNNKDLTPINYLFENYSHQDYNDLVNGNDLYQADQDLLREIWNFQR